MKASNEYPTEDKCCGINIWSPFWSYLVFSLGVLEFLAFVVLIYCALL